MTYTQCMLCKQHFSALNTFSTEGWKETQLSGMCEKCFDGIFEGDFSENRKDFIGITCNST